MKKVQNFGTGLHHTTKQQGRNGKGDCFCFEKSKQNDACANVNTTSTNDFLVTFSSKRPIRIRFTFYKMFENICARWCAGADAQSRRTALRWAGDKRVIS